MVGISNLQYTWIITLVIIVIQVYSPIHAQSDEYQPHLSVDQINQF